MSLRLAPSDPPPASRSLLKQTRLRRVTVCDPEAHALGSLAPRRCWARGRACHRPDPGRRRRGAPPSEKPQASTCERARAQLQGSPAPLAALHDQSNHLLGGGTAAFEKRLRALRGHPVVINKWASWCGPCRAELPILQQVATDRGREIAFVGVNAKDKRPAALRFLERFPTPYPVLRGPGRADRPRAEGPGQLPGHGVRRRQGQDRVHPPGRLRDQPRPGRRPRRSTSVDARDPRRPPHAGSRRSSPTPARTGPAAGSRSTPAEPVVTETDPFLEGHEDRTPPEVHALRPGGGAPDTPGWTVRVVPNLYPALTRDAPEPRAGGQPRPVHRPARRRRARGDRQRPAAGHLAGRPGARRSSPTRSRCGASACARTPTRTAGT